MIRGAPSTTIDARESDALVISSLLASTYTATAAVAAVRARGGKSTRTSRTAHPKALEGAKSLGSPRPSTHVPSSVQRVWPGRGECALGGGAVRRCMSLPRHCNRNSLAVLWCLGLWNTHALLGHRLAWVADKSAGSLPSSKGYRDNTCCRKWERSPRPQTRLPMLGRCHRGLSGQQTSCGFGVWSMGSVGLRTL